MTIEREVAKNTGYEVDVVEGVLNETFLQLHKRLFEYSGHNGDYIGEELWAHLDNQSFYHLIGFLNLFAEKYSWDERTGDEYLARLGSKAVWMPFLHQTTGWVQSKKDAFIANVDDTQKDALDNLADFVQLLDMAFEKSEDPDDRLFYVGNLASCARLFRLIFHHHPSDDIVRQIDLIHKPMTMAARPNDVGETVAEGWLSIYSSLQSFAELDFTPPE